MAAAPGLRPRQYSMFQVLELTTICAILLSATPAISVAASLGLSLAAVGLLLRNGPLAIAMLAVAVVGADLNLPDGPSEFGLLRLALVIGMAVVLCIWFAMRNNTAPLSLKWDNAPPRLHHAWQTPPPRQLLD